MTLVLQSAARDGVTPLEAAYLLARDRLAQAAA
jgi:hypothetical protein